MASTLKPTLKLHHPAYPHPLHLYPRLRPRLCLSISTIHARILTLSLSLQNVSFEQNKTNKAIGSLCQGFDFLRSPSSILTFSLLDNLEPNSLGQIFLGNATFLLQAKQKTRRVLGMKGGD